MSDNDKKKKKQFHFRNAIIIHALRYLYRDEWIIARWIIYLRVILASFFFLIAVLQSKYARDFWNKRRRVIEVPWCSGYHVCFTRRRSPVRFRSEPFNFYLFFRTRLVYVRVFFVKKLKSEGREREWDNERCCFLFCFRCRRNEEINVGWNVGVDIAMNESRCYVDSAVLAEHQPFNRNGKALRCDYPKRALYHILHTLYAFNNCRSMRQLLFKTIQNENFRFFSFHLKRNKQRNETTRREKEAGVAERATRDKIARLVTFVSTTRDRALSWRKSPPLCSLLPVHATSSLKIFPVNRFLKYKRSLPWKKKRRD